MCCNMFVILDMENNRMNNRKRVAIYARVSTVNQTVENQLAELRAVAG